MGRINLSALRVRRRALANVEAKRTSVRPVWVDVMGDVPPAQIFTRQQPTQHPLTRVRTKTRTLPDGRTETYSKMSTSQESKGSRAKHIYSPRPLRYEEDTLRKQFFSDHPWELARPRVVLETSGDQYAHADWSTGLIQPGVPLSGECVVQRQLWLLHNIPDITVPESYDIARKEFYALRRRETTARRIAIEEAEMLGSDFGPSDMSKAMTIENKMYDDWEAWADKMNMENDAKNASFSGQQMTVERQALEETRQVEQKPAPSRPAPMNSSRIGGVIGSDVFQRESRKREKQNVRDG